MEAKGEKEESQGIGVTRLGRKKVKAEECERQKKVDQK